MAPIADIWTKFTTPCSDEILATRSAPDAWTSWNVFLPASDNIPTQLELTFAKNPNPIGTDPKIPHELDQPANPKLPDIKLLFEN